MKEITAHSCTVCGDMKNSKLVLRKEQDGGGNDDIALFRCGQCQTTYLGGYSESFDEDLYAYCTKYHGLTKYDVYDPLTRIGYQEFFALRQACGNW